MVQFSADQKGFSIEFGGRVELINYTWTQRRCRMIRTDELTIDTSMLAMGATAQVAMTILLQY